MELMDLLYEAALRASSAMGDDLLKMSCYVSNWGDLNHDEEEVELEAA